MEAPPSRPGRGARPRRGTTAAAAGILLPLGLLLFASTGRDDSYITLWPAHTLAHQGVIANYNGEAVEQSSSLLHVLLLAGAHRLLGTALPTLGVLSSIAFALACLPLQARLAAALGTPPLFPLLLTATSAYFVYWSFSGMETTIAAFLGLATLLAAHRYLGHGRLLGRPLAAAAAAIAAFCAVRPESAFILLSVLGAALGAALAPSRRSPGAGAGRRDIPRRLAALLLITLGVFLLLVAFRTASFSSPFPQPVTAKLSGLTLSKLGNGVRYLRQEAFPDVLTALPFLGLVAALAYHSWRGIRRPLDQAPARLGLLCALFIAANAGFVLLTGGDWMEGGRFLVPFLPVGYCLLAAPWGPSAHLGRRLALSGLLLAQLVTMVHFATSRSMGLVLPEAVHFVRRLSARPDADRYALTEMTNIVRTRDILTLAALHELIPPLLEDRPEPLTLMSGQMGMIPFHLARAYPGRLRFLDPRGLVERSFTDCEVTASLPRTAAGLFLSYGFYIRHWPDLVRGCGFTAPDLIVDLLVDVEVLQRLGRSGYVAAYVQRGRLPTPEVAAGRRRIRCSQFVVVRGDLAAGLGLDRAPAVAVGALLEGEPGVRSAPGPEPSTRLPPGSSGTGPGPDQSR